jgi:hypothetical protein
MTSRTVGIVGYLVLAAAALAIATLSHHRGARVMTATDGLSLLMRSAAGRVTVLLAWLWTGWHFFVR